MNKNHEKIYVLSSLSESSEYNAESYVVLVTKNLGTAQDKMKDLWKKTYECVKEEYLAAEEKDNVIEDYSASIYYDDLKDDFYRYRLEIDIKELEE